MTGVFQLSPNVVSREADGSEDINRYHQALYRISLGDISDRMILLPFDRNLLVMTETSGL